MDNYFTSFRLLTHLGVNNIRGRGVFNKNSANNANTLSSGTNIWKKRNVATLSTAAYIKQKRCAICVAD